MAGVAALGTCALLVTVDPAAPGGPYPPCPFRLATGLSCPGCGSLRALSDLLRGDLAGALGHNVLLVAALPVALLAVVALAVGRRLYPAGPRATALRSRAPVALLVLALAFGVARNLPWSPFSGLAP